MSNAKQNLSVEGLWCQPIVGSEKPVVDVIKLQGTGNMFPRWWVDVDRKRLIIDRTWNGSNDFGDKMWLDEAMFKDGGHENEGLWVLQKMSNYWMTSLEHINDTKMSWKHWPKTKVMVWWTIGMKNHQEDYLTQKSRCWSESAMLKSDLLP